SMTWPLVNPLAGYITLSRFDSVSCRPPTSTVVSGLALLRLGLGQAGLEGGHEIDDGGGSLGDGLGHDLLAGRLLLDELHDLLAVLVVELVGVELGRQ